MTSSNGQRMHATAVFVFPRLTNSALAEQAWIETDTCYKCGETVVMSEGSKHEYDQKRRMIEHTFIVCETCIFLIDELGREDE